jgi:molecular chaperone HtpG
MAQGNLKIHTENILPIIKKWLYSDKDIFLRELVSNACDALNKAKILRDRGEISALDEDFRIDIKIDKNARTLTIADTGIGMSGEEVEKYIAQVAFSGAEEFLSKYKTENEKDQIIGHFGLGFYSAYMVSEKVEIQTLSYQPNAAPCFWSCDGTSQYTIDAGNRPSRGTEIILFIDKDNDEFLEETKLRQILQRYCAFLPFPIHLNGTHVNNKEPLWIKPASQCTEKDYLEFFRLLYPLEPDPIFWIHLNIDYPFNLKGILYFPKIHRRFDWMQSNIKLFCNRVFVSDNCKDLIPDYLMVLRGALDSPDIPLNVSRSYLQMDKTVRQLSSHISKKVADRLTYLYQNESDKFYSCWSDVEMIVKLGILQDEKFYERVKDFLVWKTLKGAWTTIENYLEQHKDAYKNKVFYTSDEKQNEHFLNLYHNKGIEVLVASSPVDTTLISFLEGKLHPAKFQRIDGGIDESILDTDREKTLLDADGKTEAVKIADFIRSKLGQDQLHVEAKSLASDSLPAFIVFDEEMRRLRDYMALSNQSLPPSLRDKRTFVVNTNSKLIASIYSLDEKHPELAKDMVNHIYELSLLSQKELDQASLSGFVARSSQVLEKLAELHKKPS